MNPRGYPELLLLPKNNSSSFSAPFFFPDSLSPGNIFPSCRFLSAFFSRHFRLRIFLSGHIPFPADKKADKRKTRIYKKDTPAWPRVFNIQKRQPTLPFCLQAFCYVPASKESGSNRSVPGRQKYKRYVTEQFVRNFCTNHPLYAFYLRSPIKRSKARNRLIKSRYSSKAPTTTLRVIVSSLSADI